MLGASFSDLCLSEYSLVFLLKFKCIMSSNAHLSLNFNGLVVDESALKRDTWMTADYFACPWPIARGEIGIGISISIKAFRYFAVDIL